MTADDKRPTVFADFNNCDEQGRVRLNTRQTLADLKSLGLCLTTGMAIRVSDGELVGDGTVAHEGGVWVADVPAFRDVES